MPELKKYFLLPLGCAQNISDAERVATILEADNYVLTSDEKEADIICVLACSVRQSAIDRIYGLSKNWKKYDKKSIKILSGCVLPKDKAKMEGIFDIIFEIQNLADLPNLINNSQLTINPSTPLGASKQIQSKSNQKKNLETRNSDLFKKYKLKIKNLNTDYFNYLSITPKHTNNFQALVPIMNGCNNFCSYCAVPYTRGREVSRPMEEIITEVKELIEKGYKEITLLGQNVNSYQNSQKDTDLKRINTEENKTAFQILLEELDKIPGKFWIRFISNHPKDFSNKLIKTLPKLKKVTPYIHLPVQSGSNKILKKMNRKYTREDYFKLVDKIRKYNPGVTITTDTIVGFPGETEKDFQDTVDLYEKVGFDMAYIAQYSPRFGTLAEKMKNNISREEKKRRDKVLNITLAKSALKNNKRYVGREVEVLVEKSHKGYLWGRTDTYKLVKFGQDPTLTKIGEFAMVKVGEATPWVLIGESI